MYWTSRPAGDMVTGTFLRYGASQEKLMKNTLRVMYVVNAVTGGVGRYLSMVAPRLAGHGIEAVLVNLTGVYMPGGAGAFAKVKCYDLSGKGTGGRLPLLLGVPGLAYHAELEKLAAEIEPSLIHSHYYHTDVLLRSVAAKAKVPHVVHVHGVPPVLQEAGRRWRWRLIGRRYRRMLNSAGTYVILCSEHIRPILQGQQVRPRWLVVLPNGVDCQRFDPAAEAAAQGQYGWEHLPKPIVVYVGRLDANKDVATAVRAAGILQRQGVQVGLLVVGEGPDKAALEQLVIEEGVADKVFFAGERADVPAILGQSDIFCICSRSEGHCLAVLEAMAMRLPIVSSDIAAMHSAVLPGTNGQLARVGDPASFAEALGELAADPDKRVNYGRASRALVEQHFSIEVHTRKLAEHYRAIIQDFTGTH